MATVTPVRDELGNGNFTITWAGMNSGDTCVEADVSKDAIDTFQILIGVGVGNALPVYGSLEPTFSVATADSLFSAGANLLAPNNNGGFMENQIPKQLRGVVPLANNVNLSGVTLIVMGHSK